MGDITNAQSSGSIADYQTKINSIIENFDGYEKYQYYSSGSSDVYPKTNDTKPYLLALQEVVMLQIGWKIKQPTQAQFTT